MARNMKTTAAGCGALNAGLMHKRSDTARAPLGAWTTAHCADEPGRPYFDPYRHVCVDAGGHTGYEPPPATPDDDDWIQSFEQIRQTNDARKLCQKWTSFYGTKHEPIINPTVTGEGYADRQVGYHVCDKTWGQIVKGWPQKARMHPRETPIQKRQLHNWRANMDEAARQVSRYPVLDKDIHAGPLGVNPRRVTMAAPPTPPQHSTQPDQMSCVWRVAALVFFALLLMVIFGLVKF